MQLFNSKIFRHIRDGGSQNYIHAKTKAGNKIKNGLLTNKGGLVYLQTKNEKCKGPQGLIAFKRINGLLRQETEGLKC